MEMVHLIMGGGADAACLYQGPSSFQIFSNGSNLWIFWPLAVLFFFNLLFDIIEPMKLIDISVLSQHFVAREKLVLL